MVTCTNKNSNPLKFKDKYIKGRFAPVGEGGENIM